MRRIVITVNENQNVVAKALNAHSTRWGVAVCDGVSRLAFQSRRSEIPCREKWMKKMRGARSVLMIVSLFLFQVLRWEGTEADASERGSRGWESKQSSGRLTWTLDAPQRRWECDFEQRINKS